MGHYFLIKDTSILHSLKVSDFEHFENKNDKFLSKLDTTTNPKYIEMKKAGGAILLNDCDISISIPIEDIKRKIKNYQKQDKKAGRPVVDLLVEEVQDEIRTSKGNCIHCRKGVSINNWCLDRINNSKSHSHRKFKFIVYSL